jgi:uncharacterized membrane protein HdeD (DUF308 family)
LKNRADTSASQAFEATVRTLGLLSLLAGCVILMLPMLSQLLRRTLAIPDGNLIGGALLCLGIAALVLSRSTK